jgi:pimeloyl-ACP methyl ester carboxylesterase
MTLDIRYVRSGGVAIAYQVVGEGDVDLLFVPDYVSNLVYGWEVPRLKAFYEQLAERFRLILFDKRGTGLSDLGGHFPALETRMDDVRAVLDAARSSSAVLLASHDGCSMAALYAATYPERVRALVLFHPVAHDPSSETEEAMASLVSLRDNWGTTEFSDALMAEAMPTLCDDPRERESMTNLLRVGASPAVAYALNRAWFETDLREVLPLVRVPTLVLHREGSIEDMAAHAADVARRIPGARAMRVSGTDYAEIFLSPEIPEEVERFVSGEVAPEVPDSVLATILFTDIVGSSTRAAELGDRAWLELLERHHALVRRELTRYRGEERDTAGDVLRHLRRPRAGDPLRRGDRRGCRRARARPPGGRAHGRVRAAREQGGGARGGDRRQGRRARTSEGGARLPDGQGPRRGRRARLRRARLARAEGRPGGVAPLRCHAWLASGASRSRR